MACQTWFFKGAHTLLLQESPCAPGFINAPGSLMMPINYHNIIHCFTLHDYLKLCGGAIRMRTCSASTAEVLQLGLPFFMTDSNRSRPPALVTASAVCGLPSTAALMAAAAADATFVEDPYEHHILALRTISACQLHGQLTQADHRHQKLWAGRNNRKRGRMVNRP